MNVLLLELDVKAVSMIHQSFLTPYLYNSTSGIVVDIGERIDIVAITEGNLCAENALLTFGGVALFCSILPVVLFSRLFS